MNLHLNKGIRRKMAAELQRAARLRAGVTMVAGAGSTGTALALAAVRWLVCQGLACLLLAMDERESSRTPKKRDT